MLVPFQKGRLLENRSYSTMKSASEIAFSWKWNSLNGKKIKAFVPNDSCLNFIEENNEVLVAGFERPDYLHVVPPDLVPLSNY